MSRVFTLAVLSDVHYFSAAEAARGRDYEMKSIPNPLIRHALRVYRHYIWLRHPFDHSHLLDKFIERVGPVDHVIGNGDYSCDSAFVGVSDDAACESARDCLGKLRGKFGDKFLATIGDHELGKYSLVGSLGGMRLASYRRTCGELALHPFWKVELGRYVLIGVTSSLIALPVYEVEALPEERPEWRQLREQQLAEIRKTFAALKPDQRVILFCHDPTALPFLGRDETVRSKLSQVEHTIIGHLHSNLFLWQSRRLAGIPVIRFLGNGTRRMSSSLSEARLWKPFHVTLCPALAGIELLKDGGFLKIKLDEDAEQPAQIEFQRLPR
jgi:3',5'-cyclic AMP phosphodiesterase CpdA